MFLSHFDPASIDPKYLVNRKEEFDWLVSGISDYMSEQARLREQRRLRREQTHPQRGSLSFCVSGARGIGKTILTRAALFRARQLFSDQAIFVEADCRAFHSAREILKELAHGVVDQLISFSEHEPTSVPLELIATARALATLTTFENAQLKTIHQHLINFKSAANLKGARSFLNVLSADFQISLQTSSESAQQLAGEITFDTTRLCKALIALLADIREHEIDIVVYIDNMDEISHRYRTDTDRQTAERETQTILLLNGAPIVLIVNMRDYYQSILPPQMRNRRILQRLSESDLHLILQNRLDRVHETIKSAFQTPTTKSFVFKLARIAPTPLAFLMWIKVFAEADALSESKIEQGINSLLTHYYGTLPASVWKKLAMTFSDDQATMDGETLLHVCGNEAVRQQVLLHPGVLPMNFWNPTTFYTLDPELQIVRSVETLRSETT